METITITPYSVVALVGAPGCGKVHFAENRIIPPLKKYKISHTFFNEAIERNNPLDSELQFPVSSYVYITFVNSEEGLQMVKDSCKKHQFKLIVINFNGHLSVKPETNVEVYELDIAKEFSEGEYYLISYARSTDVLVKFQNPKCCIVSDVHGCWDQFRAMLLDNKGIRITKEGKIVVTDETKYVHHIINGDYIDKGSFKGIRKMVNFLFDNMEHFTFTVGNHEYWVYQYLKGNLDVTSTNAYLIGNWFQSVLLFQSDEALKQKFFALVDRSYHCVDTPFAIITHAPCPVRFLRKEDEVSKRNMRNMSYPKNQDFDSYEAYLKERNKFFKFLLDEADQISKYHIFGHTMLPEVFQYKNKICIDTGCVVGGKLTTANIDDLGELTFKHYENPNPEKRELLMPYFSFDYKNEPFTEDDGEE